MRRINPYVLTPILLLLLALLASTAYAYVWYDGGEAVLYYNKNYSYVDVLWCRIEWSSTYVASGAYVWYNFGWYTDTGYYIEVGSYNGYYALRVVDPSGNVLTTWVASNTFVDQADYTGEYANFTIVDYHNGTIDITIVQKYYDWYYGWETYTDKARLTMPAFSYLAIVDMDCVDSVSGSSIGFQRVVVGSDTDVFQVSTTTATEEPVATVEAPKPSTTVIVDAVLSNTTVDISALNPYWKISDTVAIIFNVTITGNTSPVWVFVKTYSSEGADYAGVFYWDNNTNEWYMYSLFHHTWVAIRDLDPNADYITRVNETATIYCYVTHEPIVGYYPPWIWSYRGVNTFVPASVREPLNFTEIVVSGPATVTYVHLAAWNRSEAGVNVTTSEEYLSKVPTTVQSLVGSIHDLIMKSISILGSIVFLAQNLIVYVTQYWLLLVALLPLFVAALATNPEAAVNFVHKTIDFLSKVVGMVINVVNKLVSALAAIFG